MARQALVILALVFVSFASAVMAEGPAPSPSHKAEAPNAASSPSTTTAKAPTSSSVAPKAASPTASHASTPSTSPSVNPKSSAAEAPTSESPSSDDLNDSPSTSPVEGPAAAGPSADAPAPADSTPADVLAPPPKKNGAMTRKLSAVVGIATVAATVFFS